MLPGSGSGASRKTGRPEDRKTGLTEGAARLGWDQQEDSPGLHRFMDHAPQAGD